MTRRPQATIIPTDHQETSRMTTATDPTIALRRLASERAKRDAHRPGSAGDAHHAGNAARLAAELETDQAAGRIVRLEAELAVLEVLDQLRRGGYGDFGAGQRASELGRRRRELRDLGGDDYPEHEALPTRELEDAARRLILPRLQRAEQRSDEPRLRKYGRAQRATITALHATAVRFEVAR